jgi:preprotein translocase subunit SecA
MATFKIKLEDKAAFLNRMEKAGVGLDTDQAVDNKLEGYFEVIVDEPKQLEAVQTILKQSPKINTIKEMETKKKLTKSELKEMVRQELQTVLAEKKKAKTPEEKKKVLQSVAG